MRDGTFDVIYELPSLAAPMPEGEILPFAGAGDRPRALLVGGSVDQRETLGTELRQRGWDTSNCGGPARNRCPLLEGKPCEGRESADVAVVFTDSISPIGALACASHQASPAVAVLQNRLDAPRWAGDRAAVGSLKSVGTVADTVESLRAW